MGNAIFARNFGDDPTWLPGLVQQLRGPLSCLIKLQDGQEIRRHVDHVHCRSATTNEAPLASPNYLDDLISCNVLLIQTLFRAMDDLGPVAPVVSAGLLNGICS